MLRYDDDEFDVVASAALRAGMTPTGYAAQAALSVARDAPVSTDRDRDVLAELMACRAQLRRYGNNLNQAARVLNASGEAPEWITNAVKITNDVVDRIDAAVTDLSTQRRAP
jgi:hypothetical protein